MPNRQGWLASPNVCSYENVGCNDAKEVDTLDMYSIGMSGHIPTEIGLLSLLTLVKFGLYDQMQPYFDKNSNKVQMACNWNIGKLSALMYACVIPLLLIP